MRVLSLAVCALQIDMIQQLTALWLYTVFARYYCLLSGHVCSGTLRILRT